MIFVQLPRRIRKETKEDEQRATRDLHHAIAHLKKSPEDVPADLLTKLWAYETNHSIDFIGGI